MPRNPNDPVARRYEILERLGDSGSRVVYRARERATGTTVAIEIRGPAARIRPDLFALLRARDPCIAGVIDAGRGESGECYVVSEWVPGAVSSGTLTDRDPQEITDILIGALRGLQALHAAGLWHGAIRPGNLLVDRDRLGTDPAAVRLTGHAIALAPGELSHGAPEQVASPGDPRSDLYALGAVAYELCTGVPPHTASSPRRLIETRSRLAPRDPRERARRPIPDRLADLMSALLAPRPGHRPPTAIAALEQLDALGESSPAAAARAQVGAFCVGRDRDLRELEAMWDLARGGKGGAALISGPRGIGKSRLLAELCARVELDGGTVLRIAADRSPLLAPTVDTRRIDLEARFARAEAALRAIDGETGDRPALIAIESIDAVDESRAELLAYLARAAASTHHLFCLAARPAAVSSGGRPVRRSIERAERGAVFDLTPLDDDSFRRMIDDAFGPAVATVIAEPLHRSCAGNPGSAAAAVQSLIDRGQLRGTGRAWTADEGIELPAQPADPDQPIADALAALPARTREIVCQLSVLAPAFDRELAVELCRSSSALLAPILGDAAAANLISGDPAPDDLVFAPGAAEQAARLLAPDLQQALHRRAADRLCARTETGRVVDADAVARHHACVPEEPQAIEWGLRAAEQCAAACDHRGAVCWYQRVLAAVEGGRATAVHERIAELSVILGEWEPARDHLERALHGWSGNVEHRLGLVCRLAEAHAVSGKPQAAIDLAMSALDEARQSGLVAAEIRAHLAVGGLLLGSGDLQAALEHAVAGALLAGARGDSATIAELGRLRGRIESAKSDLPAALVHLDEAQRAAEQSGDELLYGRVLHDLARAAIVAGDYARADSLLERTTVIFERCGHLEPLARSLNNHGAAHYYQGRWQRAREAWERFRSLCERIDDRAELTLALNNLGSLYRDMGELRDALEVLDRAARTAEDGKDERIAAMIVGNRGEVLAHLGDYTGAADCYARALNEFERLGSRSDEIETRRRLCELAIATGRINDALDRVVDIAREAKDAGIRLEEGILHRVAATALRHQGQLESAEWFCTRADDILSELGARHELAKLEAEWGELAAARGDREGAAAAMRRAVDVFEQLEARWDLARARTRLKALTPDLGGRMDSPRLLLEMAQASAGADVDALLSAGLDRVLALTQLDRGFILLLDEDGRPRQRVRRERSGAFGPDEVEFSGSIVRRVASTGESVALTDVDTGTAAPTGGRRPPSVISLGLRRVMCAPMLAAGRIIGIVYVDSRGDTVPQDDRDLGLLASFAAEASAVVETARLESEVQRKSELMAILAHEIRNPLAGILGFAELGCDSDNDKTRELFERIKRDGERLRRLVDNVLELARHDAGKVDWLFEPLDVAALVEEVVDTFRPACAQRSLSLEVRTSELTARARANGDRIAQVLTNLIGNAVKFTPPGGSIRIAARTEVVGGDDPEVPPMPAHELEAWGPVDPTERSPGSYVRIDVSDTGPGMSEEIRSSLFEKFRQGKSGRKGKGVGLGLYISREIIGRHGGSIWVNTQPGEGATFSFRLPVADDPR